MEQQNIKIYYCLTIWHGWVKNWPFISYGVFPSLLGFGKSTDPLTIGSTVKCCPHSNGKTSVAMTSTSLNRPFSIVMFVNRKVLNMRSIFFRSTDETIAIKISMEGPKKSLDENPACPVFWFGFSVFFQVNSYITSSLQAPSFISSENRVFQGPSKVFRHRVIGFP